MRLIVDESNRLGWLARYLTLIEKTRATTIITEGQSAISVCTLQLRLAFSCRFDLNRRRA